MKTIVNLYSNTKNEIKKFLCQYFNLPNISLKDDLKWEKVYENPTELADILGTFIDNNEKYNINIWISIDNGFFINVTDNNINDIIKYLYERFPY